MRYYINRARTIYQNEGFRPLISAIRDFGYHRFVKPLKGAKTGMQNRHVGGAIGLCAETLTGKNPYMIYLNRRTNKDGTVTREINGLSMQLDLNDAGLSKDLICQGVREKYSSEVYRTELARLSDQVDKVVVLELGANIGYYALLAADVLGNDGRIYAFEPSPANIDLLRSNLAANGFTNQVTISRRAIGADEGTVAFELTEKHNQNRLQNEYIEDEGDQVNEIIEVETTSVDSFLDEKGISENNVNVVRMDVQGAEWEVFQGMTKLLDSDVPMVLFIETHPDLIGQTRHSEVIDQLQSAGFSLVNAATSYEDLDIHSLDNPAVHCDGMELILRRA